MYQIQESGNINKINSSIILNYNENLKITYNYYIYQTEVKTTNQEYNTFSNFCLLKVVNCYESCDKCNVNVAGTEEIHQCLSCKNGYNKFNITLKDNNYFNCYGSNDTAIQNHYYLDKDYYNKCNDSCLTCSNGKNCSKCNDGYYYREDEFNYNNKNFPCYNTELQEYYLYINKTNKLYKKCYFTCLTCFNTGNPIQNNCIDCKNNFVKYPYDPNKCTINYKSCPNFWRINETNNIECIDSCNNNRYIIHSGKNKNQCVNNCQSYFNPLSIWTNSSFLSYSCGNYKYCITLELCELKKWKHNSTTCYSEETNPICFDVDDPTPVTDKPTIVLTTQELVITTYIKEQPEQITGNVTIVKNFEFNEGFNSSENFINNQMYKYIKELNLELNSHEYLNGIDFITVNHYADFILIIYPLYKEDYLYKNVLKTNNYCFANFNEFFKEAQYIKQKNTNIILIGLIEFISDKIPINLINYFFFEYDEGNNIPIEIKKENFINSNNSTQLKIEYPLYNYNNSNIIESYSSNLISTIKELNMLDKDLSFYNESNDVYTDICRTFTSEEGTDMTINDRIETYLTKISLCENRCEIITVIDKGNEENPRSVCQCEFKETINKNDSDYNFIYEKIEGKNISNFNALNCAKKVFAKEEIMNNFIFWIFIFLIFIFVIIFLIISFCGQNSVEDILKIKNELIEKEDKESKSNIYNINKISNSNSSEKYQSLDVKGIKFNSKNKNIITSKISYDAPPKKFKERIPPKNDNKLSSKSDSNSIHTTINFNNKIEFKIKNESEEKYEEIFPDYNEVLNNNYYENKYLKNNYISLKLTLLNLKKYFSTSLQKDEHFKHNNTDNEDNNEDLKSPKNKRKKNNLKYYKNLLPDAELSEHIIRDYYETIYWETEYDLKNKKNILKKSSKYFEVTNSLSDEKNKNVLLKNKRKKLSIKNSKELNESNMNENDSLYIHKKKKSISSKTSNEKKSGISYMRSFSKSNSVDKYFFDSSITNIKNKVKYSFCKFYWIYLNKREFCLLSIYNIQDNIASYIRISTFIFVLTLLFTINCLLLTNNQIHQRYIYKKEKGYKNEFKYIFQKELGTIFLLTLIYLVIKILFVKLIYGKLFKISFKAKEDLSPFGGIETEKNDDENKNDKRKEYLKKYRKRSLIYIVIIFIILLLSGYISVCYFGIFKNTKIGMLVRFLISFIFSIIICSILSLIIVIIYSIRRKYSNKCLNGLYNFCKTIY